MTSSSAKIEGKHHKHPLGRIQSQYALNQLWQTGRVRNVNHKQSLIQH